MKKVGIIDYFAGNIASVTKAFEFLGCKVTVLDKPPLAADIDYLVLPGVGAFGDGMSRLISLGFDEAILEYAAGERPLLGICLGMQMLLSSSEEFGQHKGLDLIPGRVIRLPASENLKIPHMGWSAVYPGANQSEEVWRSGLLAKYSSKRDFYFIHSFAAHTEKSENAPGISRFGKTEFASVVQRENVLGTQFHPEKSKVAGLLILENFLSL